MGGSWEIGDERGRGGVFDEFVLDGCASDGRASDE